MRSLSSIALAVVILLAAVQSNGTEAAKRGVHFGVGVNLPVGGGSGGFSGKALGSSIAGKFGPSSRLSVFDYILSRTERGQQPDGTFRALRDALVFTNLVGAFPPAPKYTVFAPWNDAFCAVGNLVGVPSCNINDPGFVCNGLCWNPAFLAVGKDNLQNILLGHVAPESVTPKLLRKDIKTGNGIETLGTGADGNPFDVFVIKQNFGTAFPFTLLKPAQPIFPNKASVILEGIRCKDGYVYEIATVLNPGGQN